MNVLYHAVVTHSRLRPRWHRLKYRIFSLLLDIDAPPALKLLSWNRFNLFSLHDKDYGAGEQNLRAGVENHLRAAGLPVAGGAIRLLTMPRFLGFGFNPLNVYFCHDLRGALTAILYEVNNTFGERHGYCLAVPPGSHGVISQGCAKAFYVSPFLDMDLRYEFTIRPPGTKISIGITVNDADGVVLTAALTGKRARLNDMALARAAVAYPLMAVKVVAGIYWEAAKLWLKGISVRRHKPHLAGTLMAGATKEIA